MNRCTAMPLSRRTFLQPLLLGCFVYALGVCAPQAKAQTFDPIPRNFPPGTKRAIMVVTQTPEIVINNAADRLAPGARIHDTANRLVMSAALTGDNLLINYVRESNGMVSEVWILTASEAALPLPPAP